MLPRDDKFSFKSVAYENANYSCYAHAPALLPQPAVIQATR